MAKKKEFETVGIKINLLVDKVIGAATETRQRKKGTISEPPSLFSKENYNVLIVSLDSENGVENPSFEVRDASDCAELLDPLPAERGYRTLCPQQLIEVSGKTFFFPSTFDQICKALT